MFWVYWMEKGFLAALVLEFLLFCCVVDYYGGYPCLHFLVRLRNERECFKAVEM